MKNTFLCITNEQQSSKADIKNSLFFNTSELFLSETNSRKLKFFSSRCGNLSFETSITQGDNFQS